MSQLRAAEAAFTVIGLTKSATLVRRTRLALSVDNPAPFPTLVDALEGSLAIIDEPVDEMIADFARHQRL